MQKWYILNQLKNFRKHARGYHHMDKGGLRMKPLARTLDNDQDVEAVAEYVSKMPTAAIADTVQGRPLKGKKAFGTCLACHGADGKGNQALGAPDLTQTNDWYLLTQLKNFKAGIRGADAGLDPQGASMAAIAKAIADEQTMKDLVVYIQGLR